MGRRQHWKWVWAVSLLAGCAATPNSPQPASRALTVDAALSWPLEGEAGVDRLIAAVRQAIPAREMANPGRFASRGTTQLADGFQLDFADFTAATRRLDIGVAKQPCFPTQKAEQMTGATASLITRDAHGVDVGQTYTVVRNGIRLRFTTTPEPYACLSSIHVRREVAR